MIFGDSRVTIDASEITIALDGLERRALDMEPALLVIGELLVSAVIDEFDSGGRGKWRPHAESTIKKRGEGQLLRDSGRLQGSIQPTTGADYVEASTDVEYAIFHVSSEGREIIPLRNFFDIDERAYEDAEDIIVNFIGSGGLVATTK